MHCHNYAINLSLPYSTPPLRLKDSVRYGSHFVSHDHVVGGAQVYCRYINILGHMCLQNGNTVFSVE